MKRPPEIPGLEIAAACLPASEVSGEDSRFPAHRRALEPLVCRPWPGEALVLYSDGVIEARDGRREEYGLGRLKEALQRTRGLSAQGVVQACLQDLGRFAGPAPQGDDVTRVVVVKA